MLGKESLIDCEHLRLSFSKEEHLKKQQQIANGTNTLLLCFKVFLFLKRG